jgi:hypothetical protein
MTVESITRRRRAPRDVLGPRALNRALLARQMLLRRRKLPALDAIERLVGIPAQSANAPYIGLWARLDDFRREELSRLINERQVVRTALMRCTMHLVVARDCLTFRPLVQPVFDREMRVNATHAPHIAGVDTNALAAVGRALVEERPRTHAELRALLRERWPDRDPSSLVYAIRNLLALVQVPLRGTHETGVPALTTAESWLARPLEREPWAEHMVVRYLAAFGPATVHDMQSWSGLSCLGEVVERLRPELRTFRDQAGRELFDLPNAPRPRFDVPAPPRFLPEYDNVLTAHADRMRIVPDAHRARIIGNTGQLGGTVLVDGFVRCTWKLRRRRDTAALAITSLEPLDGRDAAAVSEEGQRLLAFLADDARSHDVQLARAS